MPAFLPLVLFLLLVILVVQARSQPVSRDRAESDRIARLTERVRALEAIVTDRDRQLRNDIDRLR